MRRTRKCSKLKTLSAALESYRGAPDAAGQISPPSTLSTSLISGGFGLVIGVIGIVLLLTGQVLVGSMLMAVGLAGVAGGWALRRLHNLLVVQSRTLLRGPNKT